MNNYPKPTVEQLQAMQKAGAIAAGESTDILARSRAIWEKGCELMGVREVPNLTKEQWREVWKAFDAPSDVEDMHAAIARADELRGIGKYVAGAVAQKPDAEKIAEKECNNLPGPKWSETEVEARELFTKFAQAGIDACWTPSAGSGEVESLKAQLAAERREKESLLEEEERLQKALHRASDEADNVRAELAAIKSRENQEIADLKSALARYQEPRDVEEGARVLEEAFEESGDDDDACRNAFCVICDHLRIPIAVV